jgi:hypothetical protein
MEVPMEQIVEQLKARREFNREMLKMAAICLGVCFDEKVLDQIRELSMEAQACNDSLRAILGDHWEILEDQN